MERLFFRRLPLLLSLVLAFPVLAGEVLSLPRLPPPAQAPADRQLRAFLSALSSAVRQRDPAALTALMASDVRLTFGPPPQEPPEEFLKLADPNTPIWTELRTMLDLGGAYPTPSRDHYCIPYTYAAFPDDLDAYNHHVVIESSVPVRSAPDKRAEEVTRLDHAIVRTDFGMPTTVRDDDGAQWTKIYLNAQTAYVPTRSLRSPIGYRACFGKRNDGWRITGLVAGD